MQAIQTALSTWKPGSLDEPAALPQKWVARIFERLSAQLGSKVADLYAGVPPDTVQAEWATALADYHPDEINRGLKACQARVFAPTLGEFLRLCRPCLDPEAAFIEAGYCLRQRDEGKRGDWTHPAVYWAASAMSLEVRAGNYRDVRKRWEWLLAKEMLDGWKQIPEPLAQLENQTKTRPPTEQERYRMREFRELVLAGFTPEEIRLGFSDEPVRS